MKPEKALVEILQNDADVGAIAGNRIYPQFAPQHASKPYLVYNRTSAEPASTMSGRGDVDPAQIQLDGLGEDYATLQDLMKKAAAALEANAATTLPSGIETVGIVLQSDSGSAMDPYAGTDRRSHRIRQDWLIPTRT